MINKVGYKLLFVIFLIFALRGYILSHFGLNLFDYGDSLINASRIIDGDLLYKDIWNEFPPGDAYFPAFIVFLFGDSLFWVRFIEYLLYGLFVVVVALIASFIVNRKFLLLIPILFFVAGINDYARFYYLLFYLSVYFFVLYYLKKKFWLIYLSGLFLGIGTFFRHDTAITTGAAIGLIMVINWLLVLRGKHVNLFFKQVFFFALGFVPCVSFIFYWLYSNQILDNFIQLIFIDAFTISNSSYSSFNLSEILYSSWSISGLEKLYTFVLYLILIPVYIIVGVNVFYLFKQKDFSIKTITILCLLIMGLLQLPYTFYVFDKGHLIKGAIPAIILGVYIVQLVLLSKKAGLLLKILVVTCVTVFIFGHLFQMVWWIRYNDTKVNFQKGSVYLNSTYKKGSTQPSAATLQRSVNFIKNNSKENDYVFIIPYHAMLYYLTDRRIPNKYNNLLVGYTDKNEEDQIIASLIDKDVKVVVYDARNSSYKQQLKQYNKLVHEYIIYNYEVKDTTPEGWLLMLKK